MQMETAGTGHHLKNPTTQTRVARQLHVSLAFARVVVARLEHGAYPARMLLEPAKQIDVAAPVGVNPRWKGAHPLLCFSREISSPLCLERVHDIGPKTPYRPHEIPDAIVRPEPPQDTIEGATHQSAVDAKPRYFHRRGRCMPVEEPVHRDSELKLRMKLFLSGVKGGKDVEVKAAAGQLTDPPSGMNAVRERDEENAYRAWLSLLHLTDLPLRSRFRCMGPDLVSPQSDTGPPKLRHDSRTAAIEREAAAPQAPKIILFRRAFTSLNNPDTMRAASWARNQTWRRINRVVTPMRSRACIAALRATNARHTAK